MTHRSLIALLASALAAAPVADAPAIAQNVNLPSAAQPRAATPRPTAPTKPVVKSTMTVTTTTSTSSVVTPRVAPTLAVETRNFFFRNGDKPILFLGDSITEQQMYTTLVESYVLTRFPTWDVVFRNVGWSGDAANLYVRGTFENGLQRDILALNPAAVTIDFGMNDARGGDAAYDRYVQYSTRLVDELQKAGARVALITPSPEERYEANQPGGSNYNNMLWKYSQGLKEIAQEKGVPFVDQYTPFVQAIESGRRAGVLSTQVGGARLIPDAVHPNWAGHLVMASSILKGLGAPSLVSRAEMDGATRRVLSQQNARVDAVPLSPKAKLPAGTIVFRRTDNALPWPIPQDARLALDIPGFTPTQDLNRYELRVTRLTAPRYALYIDGERVTTLSRENLERGVNLSLVDSPITRQAMQIHDKVRQKNNLYFQRWRQVQIFTAPKWLEAADVEQARKNELLRLDTQIAVLEHEINMLRRPLSRLWQLSPAPPETPQNLKMNSTARGVALSWRDASDDEQGFVVERSTDGINFTTVARLGVGATSLLDTRATGSRPVYYRVRAFNKLGTSPASETVSNAWTGTGLRGEYFSKPDLTNPVLTRVDSTLNFDWGTGAPATGVPEDFSVRWTGQIQPKTSATHSFTALSDDGVRIWIDGRKILENWQQQAPTETKASVPLLAGKKYNIVIEYFDSAGGGVMKLFWQTPGQPRTIVPQTQLYPVP